MYEAKDILRRRQTQLKSETRRWGGTLRSAYKRTVAWRPVRNDTTPTAAVILCDSTTEQLIAPIARLEAFKDTVNATIEERRAEIANQVAATPRNDNANWVSDEEAAAFARAARPRRLQRIADMQPPPPPRRSKRQRGTLAAPETLSRDELRHATIHQLIPTTVADSGCTSSVAQPEDEQQVSECGKYAITRPPFTPTNKKSSKVFQVALGQTSAAEDVVELSLPLRKEATEAHTVKGITNNLYSINKLVMAGYIPVFEKEQLSIYDGRNTTIKVSRKAVLEGWLTDEGMWRIPLIGWKVKDVPSREKMLASRAPPTDQIANVYNETTNPAI